MRHSLTCLKMVCSILLSQLRGGAGGGGGDYSERLFSSTVGKLLYIIT